MKLHARHHVRKRLIQTIRNRQKRLKNRPPRLIQDARLAHQRDNRHGPPPVPVLPILHPPRRTTTEHGITLRGPQPHPQRVLARLIARLRPKLPRRLHPASPGIPHINHLQRRLNSHNRRIIRRLAIANNHVRAPQRQRIRVRQRRALVHVRGTPRSPQLIRRRRTLRGRVIKPLHIQARLIRLHHELTKVRNHRQNTVIQLLLNERLHELKGMLATEIRIIPIQRLPRVRQPRTKITNQLMIRTIRRQNRRKVRRNRQNDPL